MERWWRKFGWLFWRKLSFNIKKVHVNFIFSRSLANQGFHLINSNLDFDNESLVPEEAVKEDLHERNRTGSFEKNKIECPENSRSGFLLHFWITRFLIKSTKLSIVLLRSRVVGLEICWFWPQRMEYRCLEKKTAISWIYCFSDFWDTNATKHNRQNFYCINFYK